MHEYLGKYDIESVRNIFMSRGVHNLCTGPGNVVLIIRIEHFHAIYAKRFIGYAYRDAMVEIERKSSIRNCFVPASYTCDKFRLRTF